MSEVIEYALYCAVAIAINTGMAVIIFADSPWYVLEHAFKGAWALPFGRKA